MLFKRIIASLITVLFFTTVAQAANTALSGLSAAGAIGGSNLFYVVQTPGSGGVKATATQLQTFICGVVGCAQFSGTVATGDITISGGAVALEDSLNYGTNGGISLSGGGIPAYNNCFWNDVDTCTAENIRMRERVFAGNAVLLTDSAATCCSSTWMPGTNAPAYLIRDGQIVSMNDRGNIGIVGAAQAASATATARSDPIGVAGYGLNNSVGGTTNGTSVWGGYFQCDNAPPSITNTFCAGIEIDGVNYSINSTGDPYARGVGSYGLWVGAGGAQSPTNPSNAAMFVVPNGTTWNEGVVFQDGSLTKDAGGNSIALSMGSGAKLEWFTSAATPAGIISSNGVGQINFGALAASAPVAQSLAVQSVLAGTTDTAGADWTFKGSQSTGTGVSGNIVFQTSSSAASTATTQNALATVATIGPNTLTGSQSTALLNLAQTWNTSANVTGILANFTNTASGGSSNLIDLQIGGTSEFHVSKAGNITTLGSAILGSGQQLQFNGRGIFTSPGAGKIQLGTQDAAAPVAQTLNVQNVVAGTSNTAGANWTIGGSQGTGTGAGGSLIFETAPAGSTGTTQNALAAVLTLDSTKLATFAGGILGSNIATSGTIGGALCRDSSGTFIYNVGANCFAGGGSAGGSANQIQWNSAGSLAGFTMSGDMTVVPSTGVATVSNAAVIAKVLTGYTSGAGTVSATDSILGAVQKLNGNAALLAPLASPALTGTPTAPTATVGTNTTQLATTAFVLANAGGGSGTVTSVGAGCGTSTGGSPITSTGTVTAALTRRANTTTTDAIISTDCGNVVSESNASSVAVSIAQAGTTGFAAGSFFEVCNIGAGTATITPTTSTIGGASTLAIPGGSAAAPVCTAFQSDGTNYNVVQIWETNAALLTSGTLAAGRMPALTGDITTSAGAVATTLATVNSNVGSFTNANITVNAKGQITAASTGSGSGTITAGTTATSGITSGNIISSTSNLVADSGVAVSNVATLSGTQVFTGQKTFGAVFGTVSTQSGTTYTLTAADCGTEIAFTNAAAVTVTIPAALTTGCNIVILQTTSAGQVTVTGTAVSAATLHSAHSYTKTFGQWAAIGINIYTTGVAILTGDGA